MDLDLLKTIVNIFSKNNVVPLLAVIPENNDKSLCHTNYNKIDFWMLLNKWEADGTIEVAQHGYAHKLIETNVKSPLYRHVNPAVDEFANHSQDEQDSLVLKGKVFLENKGLSPIAWVSPAHFISLLTISSIKSAGYTIVSDGLGFVPFRSFNLTFIPQQFERPRYFPFGIVTFCLHPNVRVLELMSSINEFMEKNADQIIRFSEAKNKDINFIFQLINFLSIPVFRTIRSVRMKKR